MASGSTEFYHFPLWAHSDSILMQDFNALTAALDAAIPRFATGSYVGTGECGAAHPTALTFDFPPKLLLLFPAGGQEHQYAGIIALRGMERAQNTFGSGSNAEYKTALTWDGGVVSLVCANAAGQFNETGKTYLYAALG